jgi:3-oxoacyl-[acyl-carrier-protein] synthase-3
MSAFKPSLETNALGRMRALTPAEVDIAREKMPEGYIIGSGTAVPDAIVSNEELAERLGLTDEQIFKSSGIRRRRWATAAETTSSLAGNALPSALADAGLANDDIDYLIFGTMTPDRFIPGSSPAVQQRLGLAEIPCLDIRAGCCNALYAMQLAKALVCSGAAQNIAICLAEIQSRWLDLSPPSGSLSMLFGDGAAALIVASAPRPAAQRAALQIIDVQLATDGSFVDALGVRCPGTEFGVAGSTADYLPRMEGQSVILQATRKITAACRAILERNQLSVSDLSWLVPHQANANLLAHVARNLNFSRSDGVISLLEEFGNTSSASMGMALDLLRRSDRIQQDDLLLLPAFGTGFTWGAGLCRAV